MPPIRLLVVDDSVVVRKVICEALGSEPAIEVAGTAASGTIALAKIPQLNPDVITLDIEMPGMNGLETLTEIRRLYPKLPVIMFSTLTERGASTTLEALALGASDYVTKPSNTSSLAASREQVRQELVAKILCLVPRQVSPIHLPPVAPVKRRSVSPRIDIVAIGTSTGGPNALAEVIPRLPADFPVPLVVVQHMPPLFTRMLADRLNSRSSLRVHEAEAGAVLQAGHVWIARGDYHMTVARKGTEVVLGLNQDVPEHCCRPSVDVMFRSVAETFGPNVLAVVMTGMGADGSRGARQIREGGGEILVQDEASSVVWGMPGSVVNAVTVDRICPLSDISQEIIRRTTSSRLVASAFSAH
jgi:two-component system chemotaxis response regulator CheB